MLSTHLSARFHVPKRIRDTLSAQDHHQAPGVEEDLHNDIVYPAAVPFVLVHLAVLGVFWTGFTTKAVILAVVLYLVRMWAITAGYHRYFSHRSYKTSRPFQFFLAFLGGTSAQRGAIWWAAIHRHHHLHSDTPLDVHSPRHTGFLFSHVGWIFHNVKSEADYSTVPDLTRYPELVFLNRWHLLPAVILAVGTFLFAGWPGLFVGFFLSTVVLYHATFAINSLAHVVGKQRYITADDSRNNWWLAVITLGEGWHNNHHYYQSSTRQGFFWWEIDPSYYALKVLSWLGLVRDLRAPPQAIYEGEARVGTKVREKAARELVADFSPAEISEQIRRVWAQVPSLNQLRDHVLELRTEMEARWEGMTLPEVPSGHEVQERIKEIRTQLEELLAEVRLPDLPSLDDIRRMAAERYRESPDLDSIVARAQEILLQSVSMELVAHPA